MAQPKAGDLGVRTERTVSGVLVSRGSGISCPEIEMADGTRQGIAFIDPSIGIGARLELTGTTAFKPNCLGEIIVPQSVRILD